MSVLWYPNVKQAPLQGLTGMWGGTGSNINSSGPGDRAPGDGDIVTSNLFLRWDFASYNYSAGQNTVNDASGNGRHGTINNAGGAAQLWQSNNYGILDWEVNDSQNYYINNNQGEATAPLSMEFWINAETNQETGLFDSAPNQVDTLRQRHFGGASYVEWWDEQPKVTAGFQSANWRQHVYTYKKSGSTRYLLTYRNGSSNGADSATADAALVWDNFCVGVFNYSQPWSGKIGMVNVYNDELTATDVQTNWNALKHRYSL